MTLSVPSHVFVNRHVVPAAISEQPVEKSRADRLYNLAKEQQAKHERLSLERQQQRIDEEMQGASFAPSLTAAARHLQTDGRPPEERLLEWHETKQAKLADAAAASATFAGHVAGTTPPGSVERRSSTGGNPHFTGGKHVTVDKF